MARGWPKRPPTGRALLLGAVVVFLAIVLASPIHRYLATRSSVQQAAQQLADDRQQLIDLQKQQQRWSDPAYVQQQARTRLQYAMPGDTVYVVVPNGQQPDLGGSSSGRASTSSVPGTSWNRRLWGSLHAADSVP